MRDDATENAIEELCRRRLRNVIALFRHNGNIRHVDDGDDNADDVVFSLPGNSRNCALAAYINGEGVVYTSEEGSSDSDDGSESD
jgi:hypothetical protein